jgi:hypothetical protein
VAEDDAWLHLPATAIDLRRPLTLGLTGAHGDWALARPRRHTRWSPIATHVARTHVEVLRFVLCAVSADRVELLEEWPDVVDAWMDSEAGTSRTRSTEDRMSDTITRAPAADHAVGKSGHHRVELPSGTYVLRRSSAAGVPRVPAIAGTAS